MFIFLIILLHRIGFRQRHLTNQTGHYEPNCKVYDNKLLITVQKIILFEILIIIIKEQCLVSALVLHLNLFVFSICIFFDSVFLETYTKIIKLVNLL